jgi:hypothetical protein
MQTITSRKPCCAFDQVRGYRNACFKGFQTHAEAVQFLHAGGGPSAALHSLSGVAKRSSRPPQQLQHLRQYAAEAADLEESTTPPHIDPADLYRLVSVASGCAYACMHHLMNTRHYAGI